LFVRGHRQQQQQRQAPDRELVLAQIADLRRQLDQLQQRPQQRERVGQREPVRRDREEIVIASSSSSSSSSSDTDSNSSIGSADSAQRRRHAERKATRKERRALVKKNVEIANLLSDFYYSTGVDVWRRGRLTPLVLDVYNEVYTVGGLVQSLDDPQLFQRGITAEMSTARQANSAVGNSASYREAERALRTAPIAPATTWSFENPNDRALMHLYVVLACAFFVLDHVEQQEDRSAAAALASAQELIELVWWRFNRRERRTRQFAALRVALAEARAANPLGNALTTTTPVAQVAAASVLPVTQRAPAPQPQQQQPRPQPPQVALHAAPTVATPQPVQQPQQQPPTYAEFASHRRRGRRGGGGGANGNNGNNGGK
jgi:hypothetical protein